jgi:hypothetical protein
MRAAKSCTTTMAAMRRTAATMIVLHEVLLGSAARGVATRVRSAAARISSRRARATSRRAGSELARR